MLMQKKANMKTIQEALMHLAKEYKEKGKEMDICVKQKLMNEKSKLKSFKIKIEHKNIEFKVRIVKYIEELSSD